jgi:hypothetical protein
LSSVSVVVIDTIIQWYLPSVNASLSPEMTFVSSSLQVIFSEYAESFILVRK